MQELPSTSKAIAYEGKVRNVCEQLSENFQNIKVMEDVGGGFSNVGSGDLTLKLNAKKYYIEIKMNKKAQMGGTSIRYDFSRPEDERIQFVRPAGIEADMLDIYHAVLKSKAEAIEELMQELYVSHPLHLHQNIDGFPMVVGKDAWKSAVSKGMIKPINGFINENAGFIRNHYLSKGVDYIQIGGCGLFHTGRNPLHLPVPILNGSIRVELRAGASGVKTTKQYGHVCSVGLRIQGRLQFNTTKMSHTLDDYDSAVNTLSHLLQENKL